jgi:hypothetical protein
VNTGVKANDVLKTRGGAGRNRQQLVEVFIGKAQFLHELYPEHCREASRQVNGVGNILAHSENA